MDHKTLNGENKFWDRYAGRYDRFMKRLSEVYAEMLELIWQELKQEDRVLEVATGTGIIALEISRKVDKVFATDISRPMIDIASEKARAAHIHNIDFSIQDGYDLCFDDAVFDVCIVANALHVMKKPELCLKEVRRVLKPDGLLIAPTFCHGETLKARIISRIMSLYGFMAFQKFTMESCADLIEQSGFFILKKQVLESPIPLLYLIAKPYVPSQKKDE